jgi:glycosyltransferase involved in cell wall biosynthesis
VNILMFDYEYPPIGGGGGIVHQLLAEELAQRHHVSLVTSAFQDLPRYEIQRGVEIHRVPVVGRTDRATASMVSMLTYPPSAFLKGRQLLRNRQFDVINGHFVVPTCPASVPLARSHRIPHVTSVHGGDIYDPSKRFSPHRLPLVRSVVRGLLRHSTTVVAQSTNTEDNARRYYGFAGRISIIPLGIRKKPSVPAASREELGLPADTVLAVTVGRLIPRKRLAHMLHALADPGCVDVTLVIIGEGPEQHSLAALARDLGISDRIRFVGRVDDTQKWQILQVADTYLATTMHEGFGLVFLEAMAAGLPVITYDHGGHVDFLEDGATGYMVPEGDSAALAQTVARAVSDLPGLQVMGRRNQDRAVDFEIGRCAEAYEALFESLVAPESARARATPREA